MVASLEEFPLASESKYEMDWISLEFSEWITHNPFFLLVLIAEENLINLSLNM